MRTVSLALSLVVCWAATLTPCRAQHEFDAWCFGRGCGLRFGGSAPVPFPGATNTLEGSASIADPITGDLLFYSDGINAYNRDGAVMLNGSALRGSASSTQGALIVPDPASRTRYYLFIADAGVYDSPTAGVTWSIVDMTLDGGRGGIPPGEKNRQLLFPATEKLTAVRSADGCGYWILCHAWNSDAFHAYRLSAGGLNTAPVISHAGYRHADPDRSGSGIGTIGYMKASPDGRRLAAAVLSSDTVQLFGFDNASGIVSGGLDIVIPPGPVDESEREPYGVAFSPDGSRLYISCSPSGLFSCSTADPAATLTLITEAHDPVVYDRYGALQLAPDGRIYHARGNNAWLGAIRNPNAAPALCDYTMRGADIGRPVALGLPNIIDGFFAAGNLTCGAPTADFTPADTAICAGDCLLFQDRSGNDPMAWNWAFEGGSIATSTERNPPAVCYPDTGTFRAVLTVTNAFGSGTTTRLVRVLGRGSARLHTDAPASVKAGEEFTVALVLDEPLDARALRDVSLTFTFRPGTVRALSVDLSGGLLASWSVGPAVIDNVAGRARVSATAPPGAALAGTGTLAVMRCAAYIGAADTSALGFDLGSAGAACLAALGPPRLVAVEFCGVRNRLVEIGPADFALDPNRPNPFNPSTDIPFSIGLEGHVRLTVADALGRTVAVLVDERRAAGAYTARWDASAFPSGVYSYIITSGGWTARGTMVLRK